MNKCSGFFTALIIALITGSAGCKIAAPATLKEPALPLTYTKDVKDSISIGDLPWNELFSDQHLVALIDTTLNNNLDLLKALQRIEMARGEFRLRGALLRPQIDAQVSASLDRYGDYTMNGVGNFDTNLSGNITKKQQVPLPVTPDYFIGLRSSWELDIWGKLKSRREAAYADFLATEKGMQFTKTWLVAEVASRYYELLALDHELEIIRDNITLQDSALQIVQIQKMAARANELAVQQFRAQLLNTKALEGTTLAQITAVENELNVLQGRFPRAIRRDTTFIDKNVRSVLSPGLPSQLLLRRPDVQQAHLQLQATTAGLQAAKAAFYPTITLTPYLGLNAFNAALLVNGNSLAYGLLGGVTAPFLNRAALKGNKRMAEASRMEAYYNYNQTLLQAVSEVVNNLSRINNFSDVYSLKTQEVEALREAVEASGVLFKTGNASYLEVITAQRSVINAELELIKTKKEMFFSVISLYQSLGGGWK